MKAPEPLPDSLPRLLIVDDDPAILNELTWLLSDDYQVAACDGIESAWASVQERPPDIVTLDLALENNDPETGFRFLERLLGFDPSLKVILVTGNDERENARRAVKQGAFDFFSKPVNLEELQVLLRRALRLRRLEKENTEAIRAASEEGCLGRIVGESAAMQSVYSVMRKVAPTDVTVLIMGDSGTGKELVAQEIHRLSPRAAEPLVSISCGAIPENLLESELFGHEKGAFTDAHTSRPGKLELANRGTVFFDEIGELPMSLQSKLLRFLQEREIERVGGRKVIPLDVRVLSATNRKLAAEAQAGRFREDLYYRLSVVDIHVPPLRDRGDDVLHLAEGFLDRFRVELRKDALSLTPGAVRAIREYHWPGNVRELEHRLQSAAVLADGGLVRAENLGLKEPVGDAPRAMKLVRTQAEREAVEDALRRTGGNISRAAVELGVSRPTLHDLLRKHQIDAAPFRVAAEGR